MEYFLLVKLFVTSSAYVWWWIPLPNDALYPTCAPYMQQEGERLKTLNPGKQFSLTCVRIRRSDENISKA